MGINDRISCMQKMLEWKQREKIIWRLLDPRKESSLELFISGYFCVHLPAALHHCWEAGSWVFDSCPCVCRWSERNHREKIGVHVLFDQVLNMEPYCCRDSLSSLDKETFVYDLSAVVMHHGKGFGSGHYTAYCYNTEGGACALLWGKQIQETHVLVHRLSVL